MSTDRDPTVTSKPTVGGPGHTRIEDEDAAFEDMVLKASRPSLATLFQAGKDAGLIKPEVEYTSTTA